VYYRQGHAQLAVPLFQQAVRKAPKNAMYHYHLGLAYQAAGDRRKARESFRQLVTISPESEQAREARTFLGTM
jgi:Flp pilus assembly protein TadD